MHLGVLRMPIVTVFEVLQKLSVLVELFLHCLKARNQLILKNADELIKPCDLISHFRSL
jgi:hypothetical protein